MRPPMQNHHLAYFFLDRPDRCKYSELGFKVDVISDVFIPLYERNPKAEHSQRILKAEPRLNF